LINTGEGMALIIKADAGVSNALDAESVTSINDRQPQRDWRIYGIFSGVLERR
jgi:hypothetical protein